MTRTVVWVSAGAASAVAAKLVLAAAARADGIAVSLFDNRPMLTKNEVVLAYTDPGSEHPDNARFLDDLEEWFGQEIVRLKSDRYTDTWDVWEKTRYLVGVEGARCTAELKRRLRFAFQQADDRQVFGYTADPTEVERARRAAANNPEVDWWWPLIEADLRKPDCLAMVERAGIKLPVMYELGYDHNNCIGCPKGGIGYWNKIRVDFPTTFDRMAKLERDIGHAVNSEEITEGSRAKTPVWLDELDPDRGEYATEPNIECSLLCAIAEMDYA